MIFGTKTPIYLSVDGRFIKGRSGIQWFFREMAKSGAGQPQQRASVEQIRFITSDLATVDGSWTVTGARGSDGKELLHSTAGGLRTPKDSSILADQAGSISQHLPDSGGPP